MPINKPEHTFQRGDEVRLVRNGCLGTVSDATYYLRHVGVLWKDSGGVTYIHHNLLEHQSPIAALSRVSHE